MKRSRRRGLHSSIEPSSLFKARRLKRRLRAIASAEKSSDPHRRNNSMHCLYLRMLQGRHNGRETQLHGFMRCGACQRSSTASNIPFALPLNVCKPSYAIPDNLLQLVLQTFGWNAEGMQAGCNLSESIGIKKNKTRMRYDPRGLILYFGLSDR